jgi:mycothiol synthase
MTTLKIRPYLGQRKHPVLAIAGNRTPIAKIFADITNLVKLNEATGQLDDDTLVSDLQNLFNSPNVDQARDLRLWKDSTGKLIGFGQLLISQQKDEISSYLYFDVHPTCYGKTIETEILQWSEQRMLEIGKNRNLPIQLHTYSSDDKILRRVLLERQNFKVERSFLTMACSLNQDFPYSSLPSGFKLKQVSWKKDSEAWVELFNESFSKHWNHQDLTVATARDWLKNPSYLPELNLTAVAPDGTLAAFCLGYINYQENARSGRKECWIKLLGTGLNFRKLGLGKAMLLAVIKQLKAMGIEQVKLGVDAQNLTSAIRLYQSVGFQAVNTWLSYCKQI